MAVNEHFEAAVHGLASPSADPATVASMIAEQDRLDQFGIDTPLKTANFLSQTAHESGGFKIAVENLRYTTAARLCAVWPKRFPDEAAAAPYVGNPEALANFVYAGRMGNGAADSGDGFRFRGRGLIQITGRTNYTKVGELIDLALATDPDLAASPEHAFLVACGTWKVIGAAALPEDASVEAYTRVINGGLVGLADRQALFAKAKTLLGIA